MGGTRLEDRALATLRGQVVHTAGGGALDSLGPRECYALNRLLSGPSGNQFVTAAYLFVDTENRRALYSAVGHPPLLRSRKGTLERIESNGLVLGVMPESDYPVYDMAIRPGDRFLLYTGGAMEPENSSGVRFGDCKLDRVVRNNESRSASELVDQILLGIRRWQPVPTAQPDDIRLIVIDLTFSPRLKAGDSYGTKRRMRLLLLRIPCSTRSPMTGRSQGYWLTHDIPTPEGLHPYRC